MPFKCLLAFMLMAVIIFTVISFIVRRFECQALMGGTLYINLGLVIMENYYYAKTSEVIKR